MKKLLVFICLFVITSQFLVGCSTKKSVQFKEFYSQVIGFSENDEKSKPIPQDTILMLTNEDFQKFKDKYFNPREIPMESPDKEKAVLYLQIPSSTSSVNQYNVESININNKILTVKLKKSAVAQVDGKSGFNGTWKWVIFIEVDKTNLKDNMDVVVKK
ncbi:hypothetical protein [Clostridium sp. 'White wine YQ']|uniref:hypothetical protein n=1 Tax=Clostridium sp. 'White wine YQ' TaxID=3027474 RepID=UPI002366B876|nr:hypothetical protein [Clostridium sp. 'White wine YQ']MDD7793013.1 hypothetical protein [Clostridium sp. 'White wine YQ']